MEWALKQAASLLSSSPPSSQSVKPSPPQEEEGENEAARRECRRAGTQLFQALRCCLMDADATFHHRCVSDDCEVCMYMYMYTCMHGARRQKGGDSNLIITARHTHTPKKKLSHDRAYDRLEGLLALLAHLDASSSPSSSSLSITSLALPELQRAVLGALPLGLLDRDRGACLRILGALVSIYLSVCLLVNIDRKS